MANPKLKTVGERPKRVGNKTDRRGRKLRKDIHLTPTASARLRKHWKARTLAGEPGVTETEIVNALVMTLPEDVTPPAEWDGAVL